MKGRIRKISVGIDFPNNVMHYIVGQNVKMKNDNYKISSIIWDKEMVQITGDNTFHIHVETPNGDIIPWKSISRMPVNIEYDLNFE